MEFTKDELNIIQLALAGREKRVRKVPEGFDHQAPDAPERRAEVLKRLLAVTSLRVRFQVYENEKGGGLDA